MRALRPPRLLVAASAGALGLLLQARHSEATDPAARRALVGATRAGAEAECDCVAAPSHRTYLRCMSQAVKARAAGRLSKGLSSIPAGRIFTVTFANCPGAAPLQPADFHCVVKDASDTLGNGVGGVTCAVSIP
jgi:hypothetical protein